MISNAVFRAVKAATPGSYTFILPATREVPRRLLHPKKQTVGVRIPDHAVTQALLAELGEPLLSSTLLLPGPGRADDAGLGDQGAAGPRRWTRSRLRRLRRGAHHGVDLSQDEPEILRRGAGDPSAFE